MIGASDMIIYIINIFHYRHMYDSIYIYNMYMILNNYMTIYIYIYWQT